MKGLAWEKERTTKAVSQVEPCSSDSPNAENELSKRLKFVVFNGEITTKQVYVSTHNLIPKKKFKCYNYQQTNDVQAKIIVISSISELL